MEIGRISKTLSQRKDGVWVAPRFDSISYPKKGHDKMRESESNSFWFDHRFHCISTLLKRYKVKSLLDIGGGNGQISHQLQERLKLECVLLEPGTDAISNAQGKNIGGLINSSLYEAELENESIEAIGMFDVLEHIENDHKFLAETNRILKSTGLIVLTVPAYQWLFSDFDREVGHFRRYSLSRLKTVLKTNGFEIEYGTYLFSLLPIPVYITRLVTRFSKKSAVKKNDHFVDRPLLRQLLKLILLPERWFVNKGVLIPFGSSCLIVAKKKG